jgi:hypothetical protein
MDTTHERETTRTDRAADDAGGTAQYEQPAAESARASENAANALPEDRDSYHPETLAENMVTICAWCPQLHILKLQLRDIDVLIIYKQGKELRILRNGVNLTISHGICEPCRAKLR